MATSDHLLWIFALFSLDQLDFSAWPRHRTRIANAEDYVECSVTNFESDRVVVTICLCLLHEEFTMFAEFQVRLDSVTFISQTRLPFLFEDCWLFKDEVILFHFSFIPMNKYTFVPWRKRSTRGVQTLDSFARLLINSIIRDSIRSSVQVLTGLTTN